VLANLGFVMSDEEMESIIKTYGNEQNDIKYLDFINDANPFKNGQGSESGISQKSSYTGQTFVHKGEEDLQALLFKIKA